MGATDSIADLLLSGRLRPAAQVAAEAPSRTSGAPRRAGVGGAVIGLFLRVAFGSDPQAVVLHLTVRPFRGPSQQRPIVPTPLRRCCTVVRTCSDLSLFSRPVMVSTLGTGGPRRIVRAVPSTATHGRPVHLTPIMGKSGGTSQDRCQGPGRGTGGGCAGCAIGCIQEVRRKTRPGHPPGPGPGPPRPVRARPRHGEGLGSPVEVALGQVFRRLPIRAL